MHEIEPEEALWAEYRSPFAVFDDLSLARWLAQTLGQFQGRLWRMSHPLYMAYRVAGAVGTERDIWHKRLATFPPAYVAAECCGAPLLPLFTRDVLNSGLLCGTCGETAVEFDNIPRELAGPIEEWAENYGHIHSIAHLDEQQMRASGDYDKKFEEAAQRAEEYWRNAALNLFPQFLDHYPALVWEDQDDCLEISPSDIRTWAK